MDSVTYGDPGTNFPKHHSGLVFVPQGHSQDNIRYKLLCYLSYGYRSIKTPVDKEPIWKLQPTERRQWPPVG